MTDITALIEADHGWFRTQFGRLYASTSAAEAASLWEGLSQRLEVHAIAEERIFYPALLSCGADDPRAETLDAIGDHNEIRDAIAAAEAAEPGSSTWWDAVKRTCAANDDHMREEERDGLPDFRAHAPAALREDLGARYAAFTAAHPDAAGLPIVNQDPQGYVDRSGPYGEPGIFTLTGTFAVEDRDFVKPWVLYTDGDV